MTMCKQYRMSARPGAEEALAEALLNLARRVRPLAGCEGVELCQDVRDAARFTFTERWESREAYKAATASMGDESLDDLRANLDCPPERSTTTTRFVL